MTKRESPVSGLKAGVRMKGGVVFDPAVGAFRPVVHTWGNIKCEGEPEEWMSPELFDDEDDAMDYYRTNIRPVLKDMMADVAKDHSGVAFGHRELE
jgi:hypothetical protein